MRKRMKGKRDITIYDIANELQVSPSTVSRALKGHSSIGKEMTEMVTKLAQKRGYRPNHIAASLRKNKTDTIGVIVTWINRPFISSLISGIEEISSKDFFNVIISQSHDSYAREVDIAKTMYDSRVGGLIVSLAMNTEKYDHFDRFLNTNTPLVFVDRVSDEIDSDKVIIDNFAAGFVATEHLIQQDCKRIAHIGGSQKRNVYAERQAGYIAALRKYGIPIDEQLIINGENLSSEEGQKITSYFLDLSYPPEGLFCANDTSAVSAIQVAKERGIIVPDELAVIGFNNDPISLIIDPPLSTIGHPAIEMGRIAARQILRQNAKRNYEFEIITLDTELIVRKSSLRAYKSNTNKLVNRVISSSHNIT